MLSFKNINKIKTYTIAHRGASAYEHENSMEAFQKAIDMRADAIEFDIRKTKDDVLVVHHDAALKNCNINISEINLSDIRDYENQLAYNVPTLEEVLKLCCNKISLDIELKERDYEQAVVELALKYYEQENLLFTSFKIKSLEAIHSVNNNCCVGLLFHKPFLIKSIPQYVDFVLPSHALCKLGYVKKLELLGKPIIIWTVDKTKHKEKYRQQNIFALITNDPSEIK